MYPLALTYQKLNLKLSLTRLRKSDTKIFFQKDLIVADLLPKEPFTISI